MLFVAVTFYKGLTVRTTPLFAMPFIYKMIIILPRQARDKHREHTLKKEWRFSQDSDRQGWEHAVDVSG